MRIYWTTLLLLLVALVLYKANGSVKVIDHQAGRSSLVGDPAPDLLHLDSRDRHSIELQPPAVGDSFSSLAEFVAGQEHAGYLRIGHFGSNWPATVIEVQNDEDRIIFKSGDGVQHTYQGFEGYLLQVVRLSGPDNKEVLVVFRSAAKR